MLLILIKRVYNKEIQISKIDQYYKMLSSKIMEIYCHEINIDNINWYS